MQVYPHRKTTSQLLAIPDGAAGTLATLKIMRRLVRSGKKDLPIRQAALSVVGGLDSKDWYREALSVWNFVKENIRYVRDINGVETIQTPDKTLEFGQGDCDDQAVLIASLLEAIGHPTRFVAIGLTPANNYQHVYTETKIGNKWIPLETTEDWPFGSIPAHVWQRIKRKMPIHN